MSGHTSATRCCGPIIPRSVKVSGGARIRHDDPRLRPRLARGDEAIIDASREIAERGPSSTKGPARPSRHASGAASAAAWRRSFLPGPADGEAVVSGHRMGAMPPPTSSSAEHRPAGRRRRRRRRLPRDRPVGDRARTRGSPAKSSTRKRSPSSSTPSASSASCSRSSCARSPATPPALPPRYQLVMGRGAGARLQQAGLATIPAIVRETADDSMLRDALLENIHRAQLNPLEEAAAYQQLLDEFGVTHDELAARIGRSRPLITNMIRLLRLPIAVQRRVAAGVLSAGHARALLALEGTPGAAGGAGSPHRRRGPVGAAPPKRRSRWRTARTPRRRPRRAASRSTCRALQDVAERLSTAFDTRVTVSLGKRSGQDRGRSSGRSKTCSG